MKTVSRGVWLLAACALIASPAAARDYYYFYNPAVDRQAYLADRLECDELAGGAARREIDPVHTQTAWRNNNLTTGQAAVAAGIAGLIMSFVSGGENRRLKRQIERICLADKGYRRFEIEKALFKEIEKLADAADRIDRWFALATASEPVGKEMYE